MNVFGEAMYCQVNKSAKCSAMIQEFNRTLINEESAEMLSL